MTYDQIIKDLKNKVYHPVYFLQGDEPYYIDKISDYIEEHVLNSSEKEFNQSILYGKDLDVLTLLSYAKRYPMMSNHQVVIVKEAHDLKNLVVKEEKDQKSPLIEYISHPLASTILVFCYKYKSLDKRTKLWKAIEKNCISFDSKKLYDNKIPEWVTQYALSKGFRLNPKASVLLAEYLGNELTKITNEIDKLLLNLKAGDEITAEHIEENIGISKDFNVFELQAALGKKNIEKANRIANYFASNPKNNPMVLTLPLLHSYFMKIMTYHSLTDKSQNNVASELGVNPYFVPEYEVAARSFSEQQTIRIISQLREYDIRSKGVNNSSTAEGDLLKELVYKILH
ncbi:MAG: DNA polymerase III subunit delta [Bacteroidetes bacterium]|nr:DNA polymerase III subunit delta [Bacteroidota bacterium]